MRYCTTLTMPVLIRLMLLLFAPCLSAQTPVADMHLHYKWSQQEVTGPADAIELLDTEGIVMGVVIGTPAELALSLVRQAPDRIVAIFSPYREGGDWYRWSRDDSVVVRAREALASGDYHGIGELHLLGGFAPRTGKGGVLHELMVLAAAHDVPLLLHTEFSRPDSMLALCRDHPETRIVWAHAGAILPPAAVEAVLAACDNVWAGLAARDPWRFVGNPITDEAGVLLPEWRALLLRYPQRFMLGSDPVWPVDQLDRWDEADTGWQELGRFWGYHRGWLAALPPDVAQRIACANAIAVFAPDAELSCTPGDRDLQ
ncbi:MAG: amidohydrolase family protein [Thiohalobacterales bacterium]|nr:amidohydrolase family protein [Thiohalobacterales bacterium]